MEYSTVEVNSLKRQLSLKILKSKTIDYPLSGHQPPTTMQAKRTTEGKNRLTKLEEFSEIFLIGLTSPPEFGKLYCKFLSKLFQSRKFGLDLPPTLSHTFGNFPKFRRIWSVKSTLTTEWFLVSFVSNDHLRLGFLSQVTARGDLNLAGTGSNKI